MISEKEKSSKVVEEPVQVPVEKEEPVEEKKEEKKEEKIINLTKLSVFNGKVSFEGEIPLNTKNNVILIKLFKEINSSFKTQNK